MQDRADWRKVVALALCVASAVAVAWTIENIWEWVQREHQARTHVETPKTYCEHVQKLAYLTEGEFRRMDARLDNLENLLSSLSRGEDRLLRHFKLDPLPLFPLRKPDPPNLDAWELMQCPNPP